MRKILFILVAILGCTLSAGADEASHKELVKQLFTVTNMKEGVDDTCKEVINMQMKSNPMMEPFKDVITDFFTKYMSWESLEPEMIKLYMDTFTEDELRDIVSFLSSPTGILYTEKSFDLNMQILQIGHKRITDNMGELDAMISERAKAMIEQEKQKAAQQAAAAKSDPAESQTSDDTTAGTPAESTAPAE